MLQSTNRRDFLRRAARWTVGVAGVAAAARVKSQETVSQPFANGERPLVVYPQKRPLIRITTRPPQLETPFSVFNENILTPNDAFFVRYHLTVASPPAIDPAQYRLRVQGLVKKPLELSLDDIQKQFEPVSVVAVNQCSGNGRGFFSPRVPGGQMGNGAMGNARWTGARLKDLLARAEVASGAREVSINGLDQPVVPTIPDYIKAIEIDHALDGDPLLAYQMNGEPLPMLNGFPLRLVVPGYYGTYWMKHLAEISVRGEIENSYWMSTAYRIPDNPCACSEPGAPPGKTIPINRLNVRSFITSLSPGYRLKAGESVMLKGIAFDGGYGIQQVLFSDDGGKNWREAELGPDLGRFSFRGWQASWTPRQPGPVALMVKAANRIGQSQPLSPLWNPPGYMRNVVETVQGTVT